MLKTGIGAGKEFVHPKWVFMPNMGFYAHFEQPNSVWVFGLILARRAQSGLDRWTNGPMDQ